MLKRKQKTKGQDRAEVSRGVEATPDTFSFEDSSEGVGNSDLSNSLYDDIPEEMSFEDEDGIKSLSRGKREVTEKKVKTVDEIRNMFAPKKQKKSAEEKHVRKFHVKTIDPDSAKQTSFVTAKVQKDEVIRRQAKFTTKGLVNKLDSDEEIANKERFRQTVIRFQMGELGSEEEVAEEKDNSELLAAIAAEFSAEDVDNAIEEVEEEPEECQEEEYVRSEGSIVNQLEIVTKQYTNTTFGDTVDDLEVVYYADDTARVTQEGKFLLLPNARVYVDGKLKDWDSLFEVKLPKNHKVEIDTKIGFKVPEGYRVILCCDEDKEQKYSICPFRMELAGNKAIQSIIVPVEPREGAYISKIGRLIKCQIEKC